MAAAASHLAAHLSYGERRALDIGMALALRPRILLLDEPMAGMSPSETAELIALLRSFKEKVSIILVEHDMDAVFALADRISVLVYGQVIADGDPEEIRGDSAVQKAYLGT